MFANVLEREGWDKVRQRFFTYSFLYCFNHMKTTYSKS